MSTAIIHAMRILELLATRPEGLRVTDVAENLGVNRAVPHRVLQVLMSLGYVTQDASNERYRASFRLGALGLRQLEANNIDEWAYEPLRELAERTSELARLAVANNGILTWLVQVQGTTSKLLINPELGAEIPAHSTAAGKAWLSGLSDSALEEYLEQADLREYTKWTTVDKELLIADVGVARLAGYAVISDEMTEGISAIAVPIRPPGMDSNAAPVGVVAVAMPTARYSEARLRSFAPLLMDTATVMASHWPVYQYQRKILD
jgi:DNA-binding IclR family transcriptional regulator